MARDNVVNDHLQENGWVVLRFWSKEIRKNLATCILLIEQTLKVKNGNV